MILGSSVSKNGVQIRLTYERWVHIVESHNYIVGIHESILETISDPDFIVKGRKKSLIALKHYDKTSISEKFVVVIYKEVTPKDGFVITAFLTSKPNKILRGGVIWKK